MSLDTSAPRYDRPSLAVVPEAPGARLTLDNGLYAPESIEDFGRNELLRFSRYAHPLTLILLSAPSAGDEALERTVDLVRGVAREYDRLGRLASGELALLLPNTPLKPGLLVAQRIQTALLRSRVPAGPGQAVAVVGARPKEPWTALVERARTVLARADATRAHALEFDPNDAEGEDGVPGDGFVQLRWRKAYESGEPSIDRQHRALFNLANELLGAVVHQRPRAELAALVDTLTREAAAHFATEEQILARVRYPHLEEHAAHHARLMRKATDLAEQYRRGAPHAGEIIEFLVFELTSGHMLRADRGYFPHVAGAVPGTDA